MTTTIQKPRIRLDDTPRKLYFAYGMNTNPREMAGRCPRAVPLRAARLAGWRLEFRGVADIVPAAGEECHGVAWLLTPECEKALDRLEGFPSLYVKKTVRVQLVAGATVEAMVYVMNTLNRRSVGRHPPGEWYETCLREGYAHYGVPVAQINAAIARALPPAPKRRPAESRPHGSAEAVEEALRSIAQFSLLPMQANDALFERWRMASRYPLPNPEKAR